MRTVGSKSYRRGAALFVASAAVVLTAACGGGSAAEPDGGGDEGGGGNSAFAAYTECLAKNGVTITMPSRGARPDGSFGPRPDGSFGPRPDGSAGPGGGFPGGAFGKPDGVDDATWQKAQEACSTLRPTGGPGLGNGNGNRGGGGRTAAYENCLRENGVTVTGGDLATAEPAVQKAIETCKVLQPQASAPPAG